MGWFDSMIGKIKSGVSSLAGKVSSGMDWVKNLAGKVTGIPVVGKVIQDVVRSTPVLSQVNDVFNRTYDAVNQAKSGDLVGAVQSGRDILGKIK